MSREIKFRVWNLTTKSFANKGFLTSSFESIGKYVLRGIMEHEDDEGLDDGENVVFNQFTGVIDKNGKEIYEGDIVKVKGRKRIGEYITKIIYYGCGFCLEKNETYFVDYRLIKSTIEVIGNIYENPELLK